MAISRKLLNEGEHVVVSTRTHPKVLIGAALVALVVVAAVIVVIVLTDGALWTILSIAVGLLVVLWLVVPPAVRWATTSYTFTNRRFIKRSGFIAKKGRTIPLNRISGVDFDIDLTDRLWRCGTLIVTDASTDGSVELTDIPHVEAVQLKISQELSRIAGNTDATRTDDGT